MISSTLKVEELLIDYDSDIDNCVSNLSNTSYDIVEEFTKSEIKFAKFCDKCVGQSKRLYS